MPFKAASVLPLPDLACQGYISKVGNAKLSDKGVYHNIPIEVKGRYAGRDGVFFFIFEPRWFGANFDPEVLENELDEKGRPMKHRFFMQNILGDEHSKPSVLVSILGDDFEALSASLPEDESPDPQVIADLLREALQGREVVYVMKQRKDDGHLVDGYNIQSFYAPTDENIEYLEKQAANSKRKTPLVATWQEE